MSGLFTLYVLLAQAASPLPTPTAGSCPTVAVKRIPRAGGDPEWHSHMAITGTTMFLAVVLVTVNPNGTVKSATIQKSTGKQNLDDMAIYDATKIGSYKPKTVNCVSVEGTYLFKTVFMHLPL